MREFLGQERIELPDDEVVPKGIQNSSPVLALARLADDSFFGQALLSQLTEDVVVYLSVEAVQRQVNVIVREAINDHPCIVVGHSLGSVVAYRVLRALGTQSNVVKFVTIGSPLGLATIRKLLLPPALEHPAGVKSWFNAYDARDIVSLFPLDSATWPVTPQIKNCGEIVNHTENCHGISGYLDDAAVAYEIHAAMQSEASGLTDSELRV